MKDWKYVKMLVSHHYQKKVFTQFNSNLCCTLVGWLFRIYSILGHVGQFLAFLWPQNDWKWWFSTIIWKIIHAIQFKLYVYSYRVSIQNWFAFGTHWPYFGPLMAKKLLKLVASDCCMKKYSHNTIHTWFLECSQLNFGPLAAKQLVKLAENGLTTTC